MKFSKPPPHIRTLKSITPKGQIYVHNGKFTRFMEIGKARKLYLTQIISREKGDLLDLIKSIQSHTHRINSIAIQSASHNRPLMGGIYSRKLTRNV